MKKTCKIVLVGDSGTGKTCIIDRFVNDKFDKTQMSTACPSFCTKIIKYPEYNETINLDIWDTAGQEVYRSISKLFYKSASVGVLVYDITNIQSFNHIKEYWYKELKENTDSNIIFYIVGNKVDLFEEEQVNSKDAKEYAKSIGAGFYLTSAKSNLEISKLFIEAGKKYIDPNYNSESGNKANIINNNKNDKENNIKIKKVSKSRSRFC